MLNLGVWDEILVCCMLFQGTVEKVHIDGLGRTKNDIVVRTVQDLFKTKDFGEVSSTLTPIYISILLFFNILLVFWNI